jgi:hypothetical protein
VDSATHDMAAQCGDGGEPKLYLFTTQTSFFDSPTRVVGVNLLYKRSQTKCNWSLVPVDAGVDSATHDMVVLGCLFGPHVRIHRYAYVVVLF